MAFAAGRLAARAGAAQQNIQNYQDAIAQANQLRAFQEQQRQFNQQQALAQQQATEQRRVDDANIGSQQVATQQRDAQAQADTTQGVANRNFEKTLQLPKNWAKLSPDQQVAYLTHRYNAAMVVGDDEVAKSTQALIASIPRGTEQLARATDLQNRPKMLQQKFEQAKQLLQMRLGSQARGLVEQIAARRELAGMNDSTRLQVATIAAAAAWQRVQAQQGGANQRAQLGAAVRLRDADLEAGTRAALDLYNQQNTDARSSGDAARPPAYEKPPVVAPLSVYIQNLGFPPVPNSGVAPRKDTTKVDPLPVVDQATMAAAIEALKSGKVTAEDVQLSLVARNKLSPEQAKRVVDDLRRRMSELRFPPISGASGQPARTTVGGSVFGANSQIGFPPIGSQ